MPRPAVFLDRDGTLIAEKHYLADPAGVELLPGAAAALRALRRAGLELVLVTNQSGLARGYFTGDDLRRVQRRLEELLAAEGARLDATYHCPHHPEHGSPCRCRKPAPALGHRAAEERDLDPKASWMVGDKLADVGFGLALGMRRSYLVETGHGASEVPRLDALSPGERARVEVVPDLSAAAARILAEHAAGSESGPARDPAEEDGSGA